MRRGPGTAACALSLVALAASGSCDRIFPYASGPGADAPRDGAAAADEGGPRADRWPADGAATPVDGAPADRGGADRPRPADGASGGELGPAVDGPTSACGTWGPGWQCGGSSEFDCGARCDPGAYWISCLAGALVCDCHIGATPTPANRVGSCPRGAGGQCQPCAEAFSCCAAQFGF